MIEKINIWKKTEKEPKIEILMEQIDEIESEKRKSKTMTQAEEQAAQDKINRLKRKIQFYKDHNQNANAEHDPEPDLNYTGSASRHETNTKEKQEG